MGPSGVAGWESGQQGSDIARTRLLASLRDRFRLPVSALIGAAGTGKTTLVEQAVRDNQTEPLGRDIVVRCRPTTTPSEVGDLVAATTGEDQGSSGVCLTLDGVERLRDPSIVIEHVQACVPGLHVLLVGEPSIGPLVEHLGAAVLVEARDLLFDEGEVDLLAAGADHDPVALRCLGGWPALVGLGLGGHDAVIPRFMEEEVARRLPPRQRELLLVVAMSGRGDQHMLDTLGYDAESVGELTASVPLVDVHDGALVAHEVWTRHAASVRSDHEDALAEAIDVLTAAGSFAAAIPLARRSGDRARVHRAVVGRLADGLGAIDARELDELADELGGSPEDDLCRRVIELVRGGMPSGRSDARTASELVDGLELLADTPSSRAARLQLALAAWESGERGVLEDLATGDGLPASIAAALAADLAGLHTVAERHLQEAADAHGSLGQAAFVQWRRIQTYRSAGLPAMALDCGASGEPGVPPDSRSSVALALARWEAECPSEVLSCGARLLEGDDADSVVLRTTLATATGTLHDIHYLRSRLQHLAASRRGEQRTEALLMLASIALVQEDADRARAHLADITRPWGVPERAALLRHLGLVGAVEPTWVDELERYAVAPRHLAGLEVARAWASAARGESVVLPRPERVVTHVPLPVAAGMVAGAVSAGADADDHLQLLQVISDGRAAELFDRLAEQGQVPAALVRDQMHGLMGPRLRLSVLGPTQLWIGDRTCDHVDWRRARVRQLCTLLASQDAWDQRTLAAAIWGHLKPASQLRNLAVALSQLRDVLEPGRVAGAASAFVERNGDVIRLIGLDRLDVDLHRFEALAEEAGALERSGDPVGAAAAAVEAAQLWRGEALADVVDMPDAAPRRVELTRRFVGLGTRAVEALLADGQAADALDLAGRLVQTDPYAEEVHELRITSAKATGDVAAVRHAMRARAAMRRDLGLSVDDDAEAVEVPG